MPTHLREALRRIRAHAQRRTLTDVVACNLARAVLHDDAAPPVDLLMILLGEPS